MHINDQCVHRQTIYKAGYDMGSKPSNLRAYSIGDQLGAGLIAGLALVAASSLLIFASPLGRQLDGQKAATSNAPVDSTLDSGAGLADRGLTPQRKAPGSVAADRPSEVLIAAFVPAPKQPPKVTQGTGSR
jgi:hypothetical protein